MRERKKKKEKGKEGEIDNFTSINDTCLKELERESSGCIAGGLVNLE